jgi:hypothetical protein
MSGPQCVAHRRQKDLAELSLLFDEMYESAEITVQDVDVASRCE